MKLFYNDTRNYTLDNLSIDQASEQIQAFLSENGTDPREITRCRLSAEEVLRPWQKSLGSDKPCIVRCSKRFFVLSIRLTVKGEQVDPYLSTEEDTDFFGEHNLLVQLGQSGSYHYKKGTNEVLFSAHGKKHSQMFSIAIATALALLSGFAFSFLPLTERTTITEMIITPFFNMLMRLLYSIACPMIFLSVCSGIYNIGDMALLGRIGKRLIFFFTGLPFLLPLLALPFCVWFFPIEYTSAANGSPSQAFKALYEMLLSIVPSNFFSPFIDGNVLQIIFLGFACGTGILILGSKASHLAEDVDQIQHLILFLMSAVANVIPVLVFICIFNLVTSDILTQLPGIGKILLFRTLSLILLMLAYACAVYHKTHIPMPLLLKKLMPPFLIAVSTASSAAAFSTNMETAKEKLGISEKLADFGLPLGQVLYKPTGVIAFLLSALCIGEMYGVSITPLWIVTAMLVASVLSIASPPVPGGLLTCYTILFLQLGIPAQGIALALSLELIMDFPSTATDLFCIQSELILQASDMNRLNQKVLLSAEKPAV